MTKKTEFQKINVAKIDHDIEQLHYLDSIGKRVSGHAQLIENLIQLKALILESKRDGISVTDTIVKMVGFDHFSSTIQNRPERRDSPALSPNLLIQEKSGAIIVDDFLSNWALQELRTFCLESKFWNETRLFLSYLLTDKSFYCGLLTQIEEELRAKFPELLKNIELAACWGIKYNYQEMGVPPHADGGDLNGNFWITPDSSNLDKLSGGMTIYKLDPPDSWGWPDNLDNSKIMDYIKEKAPEEIHVPYKQNRLILFNSKLFHKTCPVNFGPGYADRRINITFVFKNKENDRSGARV